MKSLVSKCVFFLLLAACAEGEASEKAVSPVGPEKHSVPAYGAAHWTAQYSDRRKIGLDDRYPSRRDGKKVGIFYFLWHGSHGYDRTGAYTPSPVRPMAADTKSPYDITELLRANPSDPAYGPSQAFHYWGRPYLDYYVADDDWVLRKHAQMLCDAGVDAILVDVTNGFCYERSVRNLCDLYLSMRAEGNPTPQIAFVVHASPVKTVQDLCRSVYSRPEYDPLWFRWDGKPLMLCPPDDGYGAAVADCFTMRESWFDSGETWFGNGEGKWCWGDYYPQRPGLENGRAEAICVMPATHPHMNLGRSYRGVYPDGEQPADPPEEVSGQGIYFSQQCERALEVDPDFVFITGWNEWIAQRQVNATPGIPFWGSFLGKPIGDGDTYFVDQYNHEYSRDIEPVADGFRDNYYYYMVDFIRRYKGVAPPVPVREWRSIAIDGSMADWTQVGSAYPDDIGDTGVRDHFGWGRTGQLTDRTGRNDIVLSKVATDGTNLFFYVRTDKPLTAHTDARWMRLFIGVEAAADADWEGFGYVVNNKVKSGSVTCLQRSLGGWNWGGDREIAYAVNGREMELAIPLAALGITDPNRFTVDFKWIDNSVDDGDICQCMKHGDTAPNSRFRYRFSFAK